MKVIIFVSNYGPDCNDIDDYHTSCYLAGRSTLDRSIFCKHSNRGYGIEM